ncbi:MAG: hypothetical protein Q9190_002373 [Brigantiaea leucoxantha]
MFAKTHGTLRNAGTLKPPSPFPLVASCLPNHPSTLLVRNPRKVQFRSSFALNNIQVDKTSVNGDIQNLQLNPNSSGKRDIVRFCKGLPRYPLGHNAGIENAATDTQGPQDSPQSPNHIPILSKPMVEDFLPLRKIKSSSTFFPKRVTGDRISGDGHTSMLNLLNELEQPEQAVALHAKRTRAESLRRLERRREDMKSAREKFRLENYKGDWAFDWRFALEMLETHLPPKTNQAQTAGEAPPSWAPHNLRADAITRPQFWNPQNLHRYVQDLVFSQVTWKMHERIYRPTESHTLAIADVLRNLYHDPAVKSHLTVKTFDEGLAFFCRHRMIDNARTLFKHMQIFGMRPESSTFEIMLRCAAKNKDLHNFTFHLDMMIRYGVRTTHDMWIHLMRTVENAEVRLSIARKMRELDLIHDVRIKQDVAGLITRDKLAAHLNEDHDPQSFFDEMDQNFGSGWLSHYVGAAILDEVGRRKSIAEAVELLPALERRLLRPDGRMLLKLLNLCKFTENHLLALELLRLFEVQYGVILDAPILDVLFQLGWNSRYYNFTKVVWQYACASGQRHKNMVRKAKNSLMSLASEGQTPTRGTIWNVSAGKVITGISNLNTMQRFRAFLEDWQRAPYSGAARRRFNLLAENAFRESLRSKGTFELDCPLSDVLKDALALDRKWVQGHVLRDVPISCKFAQAMRLEDSAHAHMHTHRGGVLRLPAMKNTDFRSADHQGQNRKCRMDPELRTKPCQCLDFGPDERAAVDSSNGKEEQTEESDAEEAVEQQQQQHIKPSSWSQVWDSPRERKSFIW